MATPRLAIRITALLGGVALLVAVLALVARPWYVRWGATAEEQRRALPGDEIVPGATTTSTRAITIAAPAARTFAWVAQTGQDRGGFYSYELLEDLAGCRMPNIQYLDPALQQWKAGDKLWMYPPDKVGGAGGVPLMVRLPGQALGFGMRQIGTPTTQPPDASWSFVVQPVDAQTSRLLIRGRGAGGYGLLGQALTAAVFEPMVFVMERKMMTSIKVLAEGGKVPRWADDAQVGLWTITFVVFCASAALLLAGRRPRRRFATMMAAGLLFQLLTLVQPPLAVGIPLVAALVAATGAISGGRLRRRSLETGHRARGAATAYR
jgi:hypothetical protein